MYILLKILFIKGGTGVDMSKTFTEEDWTDPEKLDAFGKSKTLAEKAAWDFVKELPGINLHFESPQ